MVLNLQNHAHIYQTNLQFPPQVSYASFLLAYKHKSRVVSPALESIIVPLPPISV